jgi:hypothetical protein
MFIRGQIVTFSILSTPELAHRDHNIARSTLSLNRCSTASQSCGTTHLANSALLTSPQSAGPQPSGIGGDEQRGGPSCVATWQTCIVY